VSAANVKAETEDSAGRRQHADSRQCGLRVRNPKVIEIKEYAL
jgi:hypothetical protein